MVVVFVLGVVSVDVLIVAVLLCGIEPVVDFRLPAKRCRFLAWTASRPWSIARAAGANRGSGAAGTTRTAWVAKSF